MDDAADDVSPTDKWARPPAPPIDAKTAGITFQQMELDSYIDKPMPGMPGEADWWASPSQSEAARGNLKQPEAA